MFGKYLKLKIGTNGHFVSLGLVNFFNIFYRSVENYTTKVPRFKGIITTDSRKLSSSSYNFSQLKDTKIDTIYNKLRENNYEIIRNSFFLAEDEISLGNFDVQFSGSTCNLVFFLGNKIISANAGDSRSIMVGEINKNKKNFISIINIFI